MDDFKCVEFLVSCTGLHIGNPADHVVLRRLRIARALAFTSIGEGFCLAFLQQGEKFGQEADFHLPLERIAVGLFIFYGIFSVLFGENGRLVKWLSDCRGLLSMVSRSSRTCCRISLAILTGPLTSLTL